MNPDGAADPYVDRATGLLVNSLGIRDADRLARQERDASVIRDVELTLRPEPGGFDLDHLRRIHRRLFADVYPWAGEVRVCQLTKSAPFAHPAFIVEQADALFGTLAREQHLRDLPRSDFVLRLAHHLAEVNALHPFREGNGRAQRAFFRHLAAEAGWRLAWSVITAERNDTACRRSLSGDMDPLRGLLDDITRPL